MCTKRKSDKSFKEITSLPLGSVPFRLFLFVVPWSLFISLWRKDILHGNKSTLRVKRQWEIYWIFKYIRYQGYKIQCICGVVSMNKIMTILIQTKWNKNAAMKMSVKLNWNGFLTVLQFQTPLKEGGQRNRHNFVNWDTWCTEAYIWCHYLGIPTPSKEESEIAFVFTSISP